MDSKRPALADGETRWPGQLAAIDMGSNSFRLEIGQLRRRPLPAHRLPEGDGAPRRRARRRRLPQRGGGGARPRLPGPLRQPARRLRRQPGARGRDADAARGAATAMPSWPAPSRPSACRSRSSPAARRRASSTPASPGCSRRTLPRLVIDIGGRSTEMILGRGERPRRAESFQVGSVSLSMKYFPDGRFSERAFREAQIAAGAELEEALGPFAPRHWREALGSSGTVGAVSQVLAASGQSDGTHHARRPALADAALPRGRQRRPARRCRACRDDRRAVIAGGLSMLYTLAMHFGIDALQPARGALRQGVIFDLAARREIERRAAVATRDIRDASVRELQRRFQVDTEQADRVEAVALSLLDDIEPATPSELRRELRWAGGAARDRDDDLAPRPPPAQRLRARPRRRRRASRRASCGASATWCSASAAACASSRRGWQELTFALHLLCLRLAVIVCHARGDVDPAEIALVGARRPADAAPRRSAGPRRIRARCTCCARRSRPGAGSACCSRRWRRPDQRSAGRGRATP